MNSRELPGYDNPALIPTDERVLEVDLCIYGGNASRCTAAMQANSALQNVPYAELRP